MENVQFSRLIILNDISTSSSDWQDRGLLILYMDNECAISNIDYFYNIPPG